MSEIPVEYDVFEEDEIEICVEGYGWDECCGCHLKVGVEHCEFSCPFGGAGNRGCCTLEEFAEQNPNTITGAKDDQVEKIPHEHGDG